MEVEDHQKVVEGLVEALRDIPAGKGQLKLGRHLRFEDTHPDGSSRFLLGMSPKGGREEDQEQHGQSLAA
jgi:hypothetical protein